MFDAVVRPLIDPPLNAGGRWLAARGVTATSVTLTALAVSVAAGAAIGTGNFGYGLALIAVSRILDGLDGPVARATTPTDLGGLLDTVCDYVFYAGIPLGFAAANPVSNALPAAVLLGSFLLTCSSFLAFATLAVKRGLNTEARGRKAFFYAGGLVEGFETIAFFVLMALFPNAFPALAWVFAGACVITAIARTLEAARFFRS